MSMNEIAQILRDPGPTTVGTLFAFMGFYLIMKAQQKKHENPEIASSRIEVGAEGIRLTREGPGMVFALFGAALVVIQYPVALIIFMQLIAIVAGSVFGFLGYQLFNKGVMGASDIEAVFGDNKLLFKRAAPGSIFALFGVCIIVFSLYKLPAVNALNLTTQSPVTHDSVNRVRAGS